MSTCDVRSIRIFISYSHEDRIWMKRLQTIVNGFEFDDRRNGWGIQSLYSWHDEVLYAGCQWDSEIRRELECMDIFVPLISFDFFSSQYIQNVELPVAREEHRRRQLSILPILVHDVNLRDKNRFLSQFNLLPEMGRWWSNFNSFRKALPTIDQGLWAAIDRILSSKSTDSSDVLEGP